MVFQDSEVVCLILTIIFALSMAILYRAERLPRLPLIYWAVALVVAAILFTVAEGLLWYSLFNALEHVCYALAGVLFAVACWRLARPGAGDGEARP